jgi:hypothetical protein
MLSARRVWILALHATALACMASPASAQPSGAPPPGQQPAESGLQAGGLAPPPPLPGDPAAGTNQPSPTERELERAEKEDSGRGLEFFFFNVEGGYEQIGLETFKSDGLTYASSVSTKDGGMMLGAGAGVRLVFFTIGARARLGKFDQWNVGTFNGEFGVHFPLADIEPYVTLGAGYAFLGAMDERSWGGNVSIQGYDVRGGFGLDYYVTPVFSIGVNLTGEVLGLTRPGVDLNAAATGSGAAQPGTLDAKSQEVAKADGSSLGAAFTGSLMLGLHL